jgi:hypothetical protein
MQWRLTDPNQPNSPTTLDSLTVSDDTSQSQHQHPSRKFICFESCLDTLFQCCIICECVIVKTLNLVIGNALIVTMTYQNSHCVIWCSQPLCNVWIMGNVLISAAVLFSGLTFTRFEILVWFIRFAATKACQHMPDIKSCKLS